MNFEMKKNDWFLNYLYLYIFITPWLLFNAQLSITTAILFIWGVIKYKKEMFLNLKKMAGFLPLTLLFLFIGYIYLSILWSNPMIKGLEHVNNYYKYTLLFLPVILVSLNKESATKAMKLLAISFALYAVYSILIYLNLIHIEGSNHANPKGHLRHLIVGQYMVIGFFVGTLVAYFSKIKKEKILFSIVATLSFIGLFINMSRTAQISFFLILIIFTFIFLKKYIFNIKAIFLFILITFSGIYLLYENNRFDRYMLAYKEFQKAINDNNYTGSFGIRLYFAKAGIQIFKDNPIFGTGAKDNRILLQEIEKNDPNYHSDNGTGNIINHFHNEHIDTLTAYGIVGYSLLFSSIVFLIYKLRKQELYYYISLSVFLSLFFNSLANKTLSIKPLSYIYILFFLMLAIIALNKNDKEEIN